MPHTVKADTSFDVFKCSLSIFLTLIPDIPRSPATAAVGKTHWLTSRHPGGSTDDLNVVTK